MKILVGTLFIALAAFPNSIESSEGSSSGRAQSPEPKLIYLQYSDEIPTDLYYEDANGNLQPLPLYSFLFEFGNYLAGFISRQSIVPLFNKDHKIVWQDRFNGTNQIVLSRESAREFGIPGTAEGITAGMDRCKEMYKAIVRQAAEAAERERERAAENQARQGNATRGKKRGRGGRYGKNRRN